jgi:hypothetical protein
MNQHITKLVRQALKECVATPVESVVASRIDDHGIVEIPNTFAEKFAELIMQECLGCCEQVISDPVPESVDTWLNGGSQCIDEIKQHFGVKE